MSGNPAPIGKRYDGGTWRVTRDGIVAYARATDDPNPAYLADDPIAPPMYHVRPFIDLMMSLATDPELGLDLLRLVHAEHDARFHDVLRPGDVLALSAVLDGVEEKSSGRIARFTLAGDVDDRRVVEAETAYFVRAERRSDAPRTPRPAPEPPPAPSFTVAQPVSADQATRYAQASGDHNPIHVDDATAKAAGLPGVILHGLCTMAFAQRDLVDRLAQGDPRRLARLAVRWARPVFPGDTLSLQVWEGSEIRFQTVDGSGRPVVVNGRAEIRA